MATDKPLIVPALLAALALAGCASDQNSLASTLGADSSWGEANRQTMAAQIIDPAPRYDTLVAEAQGTRAATAVERYRTDKVKRPDRQMTSRFAVPVTN